MRYSCRTCRYAHYREGVVQPYLEVRSTRTRIRERANPPDRAHPRVREMLLPITEIDIELRVTTA
jgi:hypothetical protein